MMSEKKDIKDRYDGFAKMLSRDAQTMSFLHENISPVLKYFRQRKFESALELGKFKQNDRILEIGSNYGQYTTLFAQKGLRMVGVDISDKAVEIAKKNARYLGFSDIEYFTVDAENLELFADETFDGAVSFSTLRYVPNIKKSLSEVFRVLRKGGIAVLDFPNKYCPWFTLIKNKFGVENHIHDHFYSAAELELLFEETGFRDIQTGKIMFIHYTFNPKFLPLYKVIDSVCEHIFLVKEMAAIILCKGVKI